MNRTPTWSLVATLAVVILSPAHAGGGSAGNATGVTPAASPGAVQDSPAQPGRRLPATITLSELSQTYDGAAKVPRVATEPAGLEVWVTYDGRKAPPVNAGHYTVMATIMDQRYEGSATGSLVVRKANAVVTFLRLTQPYDGVPKPVTTATVPANLAVDVDYNGRAAEPIFPGTYAVTGTVRDPNYAGSALDVLTVSATALVRHAPALRGGVDGSLQVLSGENVVLNGTAWLSGDLLVPGTPELRLSGLPMVAGTYEGDGSVRPSTGSVSLAAHSVIRYLVRRVDPLSLPTVAAPAPPLGTRDIVLNWAQREPGDFATMRNLTLNRGAGSVVVPPGDYGALAANAGTSFVIGRAGTTEPATYHLQSLTVNGGGALRVVGPVLVVLAHGFALDGTAGDLAHPEWLTLAVASGGVTLDPDAELAGFVVNPAGAVVMNVRSTLVGEVICDALSVDEESVLTEP